MYKKPNFFRNNFSFEGKMNAGEFWMEVGMRAIYFLLGMVVLTIIVSVTVPGDVEFISRLSNRLTVGYGALCCLSVVALSRRRLRDAGFSAKSYLWLLVPAAARPAVRPGFGAPLRRRWAGSAWWGGAGPCPGPGCR